ncbi:unnamed protein product [Pleuronectes platessa]|uniref:Uncharacterized protein n=1 Tax=Pleuronectes platessa TaxID=8262 RepID=A0A9N7V3Y7_PLEPL|nr:unnamed protein product [Pleuronectes platessa]
MSSWDQGCCARANVLVLSCEMKETDEQEDKTSPTSDPEVGINRRLQSKAANGFPPSLHQAERQSHQAVIRLPSAEELHSSLISNYTHNNRELHGGERERVFGIWKERRVITNGREAESATQQQTQVSRSPGGRHKTNRQCEDGRAEKTDGWMEEHVDRDDLGPNFLPRLPRD